MCQPIVGPGSWSSVGHYQDSNHVALRLNSRWRALKCLTGMFHHTPRTPVAHWGMAQWTGWSTHRPENPAASRVAHLWQPSGTRPMKRIHSWQTFSSLLLFGMNVLNEREGDSHRTGNQRFHCAGYSCGLWSWTTIGILKINVCMQRQHSTEY